MEPVRRKADEVQDCTRPDPLSFTARLAPLGWTDLDKVSFASDISTGTPIGKFSSYNHAARLVCLTASAIEGC